MVTEAFIENPEGPTDEEATCSLAGRAGGNGRFELLKRVKEFYAKEVFPFIAHFPYEKKALGQEIEQTLREMVRVAKTSNAYCYNGKPGKKLKFYRTLDGLKEYLAELVLEASTPYERLRKNRCFREREYERWLAYKGLTEAETPALGRFKACCLTPCRADIPGRFCFVNKSFRREFPGDTPEFKLLLGMTQALVTRCTQKQTCFCIDERRTIRWQEQIRVIGCLIGGLIGAATKSLNNKRSQTSKSKAERREKEFAALAEHVACKLYELARNPPDDKTRQKTLRKPKKEVDPCQLSLF